jgi:hypothetical protein
MATVSSCHTFIAAQAIEGSARDLRRQFRERAQMAEVDNCCSARWIALNLLLSIPEHWTVGELIQALQAAPYLGGDTTRAS